MSEEEIRAVLRQKTPVTTQDLVAKFKARLRSSEVSDKFALSSIELGMFALLFLNQIVYAMSTVRFSMFYN